MRGDRHQRAVGGALGIDQDVDAELADALRHRGVREAAQLDEMFAGGLQARARIAPASSGPAESSVTLEAASVVRLQHLDHQLRGGVLVEIGRR